MFGKCSFYILIDNSVFNISILDLYFIIFCYLYYNIFVFVIIKGLVDFICVYI